MDGTYNKHIGTIGGTLYIHMVVRDNINVLWTFYVRDIHMLVY